MSTEGCPKGANYPHELVPCPVKVVEVTHGGRQIHVERCTTTGCGFHACRQCFAMFEPKRPWMAFCSRQCKLDYYRIINREKMRERRAAEKPPPRKRPPRIEVSGERFMEQVAALAAASGEPPAAVVRDAVERMWIHRWFNGTIDAGNGSGRISPVSGAAHPANQTGETPCATPNRSSSR